MQINNKNTNLINKQKILIIFTGKYSNYIIMH